jgi:uncharacterized membrane protein YfcA
MSSSSPKGPWRSAVEDAAARRREARTVAVTLWPLAAALAILLAAYIAAVTLDAPGPWPWFSLAAMVCAAAGVWVGARLARR